MGQNFNLKTFEAFQEDNKIYYPIVLQALNQISAVADKNSLQAGDWVIEGKVNYDIFPESGETDINEEHELWFHNATQKSDIYVRWSIYVERGRETPATDLTPGDIEYNTTITIDEVIYYTEEGSNEYHIVVDKVMSDTVEKILDKINK